MIDSRGCNDRKTLVDARRQQLAGVSGHAWPWLSECSDFVQSCFTFSRSNILYRCIAHKTASLVQAVAEGNSIVSVVGREHEQ